MEGLKNKLLQGASRATGAVRQAMNAIAQEREAMLQLQLNTRTPIQLQGKRSQRGNIRKRTPFGKILYTRIVDGFEYSSHATKGMRVRKARI